MDTLTGQRPASSSPWGCRLGVLNGLADHIACAAAVPLRTAAAVVRQRRPRRRHRPSRQLHCRELRHRGRRAWRHCHQRGRANGEPAAAADAAARLNDVDGRNASSTPAVGGIGENPLPPITQPTMPICREAAGPARSHSASFDQRRRPETLRTAKAIAFFWPTRTTSRLPRRSRLSCRVF
jgi:hypothetical protein